MMQRRRNLMHTAASQGGSDAPPYTTNTLTYQLLSSGSSSAATTLWNYATDYTFDAATGLFTLVSPTSMIISYATARMVRTKAVLGKYCIKGGPSGTTMYHMPADGTITLSASVGLYTSQVNGNVTEYVSAV